MDKTIQEKYEKLKSIYRNGFGNAIHGILGDQHLLVEFKLYERRGRIEKNIQCLRDLYDSIEILPDDDFTEISTIKELLPVLFSEIEHFLDIYQTMSLEKFKTHEDKTYILGRDICNLGEDFRRRIKEYRKQMGINKDIFYDEDVKRLSPPPK